LGYFSKLAFSDVFVILDNVNFRKRHFFDRTKIVNMHGEIRWLSLPVGEKFKNKCNEVQLSPPDDKYIDKIIKTIEYSYAKASYFKEEWPYLNKLIENTLLRNKNLVDINKAIINGILYLLDINLTKIYLSSLLTNESDATNRILAICRNIGADSIIIGTGKSLDVHDWEIIRREGINIFVQDYLSIHPVYKQVRRQRLTFEKGLSMVDTILNVGKETTRNFITNKVFEPIVVNG